MNKDFDTWNEQKKILQIIDQTLIEFAEREIWWTALGKNIGDEEDGKNHNFERPVLVLRKFSKNTLVIVPLTSQEKDEHSPFYFKLSSPDQRSYLILSQIRLISSKRLLRKMYRISKTELENIRNAVNDLIFSNRKPTG